MLYKIATVVLVLSSCLNGLFGVKLYRRLPKYQNTPDIIASLGYPAETHTVTTEDGYLLTLHRIPGSPRASSSGAKTPVLLMHGISVSSDIWVLAGADRGLGFQLADQGYDVWIGNARGNFYSRHHVTLDPDKAPFWNFTWHEMGVYDLPAVIDHILSLTNQPKLSYVGHSMGCAMFFVLTSQRPEYNTKIRLMVALAPGVYAGQQGSFSDTFSRLTLWQGGNEIQRRTPSSVNLWTFFCREGPLQPFCAFLYFNVYGFNRKELNSTLLPLYITRLQSGTSISTLAHFVQIFETERFQMFDREARKTGLISRKPEYNLSLISAPVAIYYGENDAIIRPKGVLRLQKELPNVVKLTRIADDEFNHVDFLLSIHVKRLVNDDVIDILGRY